MKQRDLFGEMSINTKATGAMDLAKIRKPMSPSYRTNVEDVYAKAKSAMEAILLLRPDITHELVTTKDRLFEYLEQLKKVGIVAIDSETSGLDIQRIDEAGFSLYSKGLSAIYAPVGHHFYNNNLSRDVVMQFFKELNEEVDCGNIKVLMHNSKYDVQVIMKYTTQWIDVYADTLVASVLLDENEPHGLKYLWNKYCMQNRYSGDAYSDLFENRIYNTFDPEKVYIYATLDSVMTFELWEFQSRFLGGDLMDKYGLRQVNDVFWEVEMDIVKLSAEMQWDGVAFDLDLNTKLHRDYEARIKEQTRPLQLMVEELIKQREHLVSKEVLERISSPINTNSSSQMNTLFYDILGFELDESTKKQIIRAKLKSGSKTKDPDWRSAGKVAMKYLKQHYPEHKLLFEAYEDLKGTEKAYSGFIVGLRKRVSPTTKKIHGGWNSTGTVTGRYSSSEPNLQNIPSRNQDIKPMFIPNEGNVFIFGDYS